MLSLNLLPIFKARGIDKPFSYLTSAGFPSYTAHNLLNAKTVTFRLSHIDKLCSLLNCTPNDLLVWTPNRNEKLADTHPITRLKKQNTDLNWQDTIKTIPLDQLSEIVKIINDTKIVSRPTFTCSPEFPSPFAKRTNQPCNPNFAKKLVNFAHALAIFQIANRWHSVSVRHMVS